MVDPDGPESPAEPEPRAPETPPVEDWATRFKYLYADFENYRRRVAREQDQVRRRARLELFEALLPIWEGVERAREASRHLSPKDPMRTGLDLLRGEFDRFFEQQGIEPVARVGEPFRSDDHEAVGEAPATAKLPDGMVAEVVRQGYRSPDGLIRTGKVIVARRPTKSDAPPDEAPAPSAAGEP